MNKDEVIIQRNLNNKNIESNIIRKINLEELSSTDRVSQTVDSMIAFLVESGFDLDLIVQKLTYILRDVIDIPNEVSVEKSNYNDEKNTAEDKVFYEFVKWVRFEAGDDELRLLYERWRK